MKIRGYQIKFITVNPEHLSIGMLVSITGKLPRLGRKASEMTSKKGNPDLGRIMGIQEDDRLGVTYIVHEYGTGEWHKYIEDKLLVIAPVLISDDKITSKCLIYVSTGKYDFCEFPEGNVDADYVINDEGIPYHKSSVKKLVARPHEIGHVLNYGPPHDRNASWKWDGEGEDAKFLYLEELHPDTIPKLFDSGGNVRVILGDDDKPLFHEGKIILDSYNMYPSM